MPFKYNPFSGNLDQVLGPGFGTAVVEVATDSGTANPTGAGVLTISGDGSGIDTSGAADVVTISFDITEQPTISTSFPTDSGTATPALNSLTISGGSGIDTSGSGSTLTIAADATVATTYTSDSGSATPAANNLNVLGGTGISTTGSGSTLTVVLDTPVSVANGGTGAITLTDGGILLGSGTSAITATAQPTNGQLLIGSTGVDPVLASLTQPAAGLTITGGAGTITFALADGLAALEALAGTGMVAHTGADTYTERTITGTANEIDVTNGDGVAGNPTLDFSDTPAMKQLSIDPGASGDSFVQFDINTTGEFRIGVDDDAADAFKISQGSALGTNDTFIMTAAGERTMPLQPAFSAYPTSNVTNATGDGTVVTMVFGTEVYDQGGDFDGTSTFTAPVTGRYNFSGYVSTDITSTAWIGLNFGMTTSNRGVGFIAVDPGPLVYSSRVKVNGSADTDMDAADTAILTYTVSGSTKTIGNRTDSYFTGHLVC